VFEHFNFYDRYMGNIKYSKILKKNWEIVALVVGITVVLALVISIFQPFQYEASTQILIIQKQEQNLDAYTATKSAERIGQNLVSIIDTSSFYNEVINSNPDISNKFPQDAREKRKLWKKNVKADVIPETGILELAVYDTDRNFAAQLVKSIAYVLVDKGAEYHGGGTDVEIKIVDDVFLSKYPARPNILINTVLALIVGILLGSALVVLSEARKLNRKRELEINKRQQQVEIAEPLLELPRQKNPGLIPELEAAEDPILADLKKATIKTMYDHLEQD